MPSALTGHMKLIIDATAAISGGKLYLEKLLPRLTELTPSWEFIVFHAGDFDGVVLPDGGARLEFRRVKLTLAGGQAGASVLRMLWRLLVLPLHLHRIKPDLFFSNAGSLPGWKPARVKTAIAVHNCMPLREELVGEERSLVRRWRLRLLRRVMGGALRRCDVAIVFSEDTRKLIGRAFGGLKHTPAVVHHGIDWGASERDVPISFERLRQLGIDQPYLLFVSHLHRYKNVLRLLEAFAELAARHPQLLLVVVGEAADRAYGQEIEQEITRRGLSGRVKHLPGCPREELLALYRGARAFVQPSLAETCSFPLLEALALGVPVAVARMSALPEMAGEAAVYFDPYQPAAMAEAIERVLWDEALRDELRSKAVAQAARFSWEETARRTVEVLAQVGKAGK